MFRQAAARSLMLFGAGMLMGLSVAAPAAANYGDGVVCDDAEDSCEVSAGTDPDPANEPGGLAPGDGGGDEPVGPTDPDAPVCESKILETDADAHPLAGERPSADHQLLFTNCTDPTTGTGTQQARWVLPGDEGLPVDPAVLAQQAIDGLRLPQPQIAASPNGIQLVRLPTWLWLAGTSWQSQQASASVPGLTVTAVAEPVRAEWVMGDGATVACTSAGTKWTASYDVEAESPTCGHSYTRSSASAPGGEYAVSVTVEWTVSWSGGGSSGTGPGMTTTASTSWPVAESQAITGR
jgi:hypothetical protein